MRLLSLFGKSDGNLLFKVNDYSDGSGSDKDVMFFKSKEEGLIYAQNEFQKIEKYGESDLKNAEKFNLKVDEEKLKSYIQSVSNSIDKQIEEYKTFIEKAIERKNKLTQKANN
jgi:hypothetical protein